MGVRPEQYAAELDLIVRAQVEEDPTPDQLETLVTEQPWDQPKEQL